MPGSSRARPSIIVEAALDDLSVQSELAVLDADVAVRRGVRGLRGRVNRVRRGRHGDAGGDPGNLAPRQSNPSQRDVPSAFTRAYQRHAKYSTVTTSAVTR